MITVSSFFQQGQVGVRHGVPLRASVQYPAIRLITLAQLRNRKIINRNAVHVDGAALVISEVKHINRHDEPILSGRW